jgi:hypothetical protein
METKTRNLANEIHYREAQNIIRRWGMNYGLLALAVCLGTFLADILKIMLAAFIEVRSGEEL